MTIRPGRVIGAFALALVAAVLGYEILTAAFAGEEAVVIPGPAAYSFSPAVTKLSST